ncbi:di-heme oxidoredictase family protein [Moraxella boevrei]|uniref:di-heme oxidoredictase family protein n=1 Tax=Faucicola boevrei TaxID=346665 RepID=UPI003736C901
MKKLSANYRLLSLAVCTALLTACSSNSSVQNTNTNNGSTPASTPASTPSPMPTARVWEPSGGNATVSYNESRPFLTLIPNLDINQISGVSQGRELFVTNWTEAGTGRALFDGVGPLFNAISCTSCHANNGRVTPYNADGTTTDGVLFRLGDKQGNQHAIWGGQLQPNVIINNIGLLAEGSVKVVEKTDNENRAFWQFNFTPFDSNQNLGDINLGARIAPQLLGMGLLDLVTNEAILANADPNDNNNDGISGRVHWVNEDGQNRIGKFGWKAINTTLRTQNATAMSQDMGLTTPVHLDSSCTPNQPLCHTLPVGGSPEISDESLTAVVDFMTALSVPARRINNQTNFDKGADLFEQVGCNQCHTPTLKTGTSYKFSELSNQTIYAYTDLLLHDMGTGLDDGVKEINAESYEWRTPPLWGIGIVAKQPNARFLHDGRAKTIEEAILWHGGEAENTRQKFKNLSNTDKQNLLEFVNGI